VLKDPSHVCDRAGTADNFAVAGAVAYLTLARRRGTRSARGCGYDVKLNNVGIADATS